MPSSMIVIIIVLFALYVLASMKTSRSDAKLVKRVHPYRRVLWFLNPPGNAGSMVFFDQYINAEPLLEYLSENEVTNNITTALVAAVATGFSEIPKLNYFVSGYRLYERNDVEITFSMKKVKHGKDAGIAAVKLRVQDDMTLEDIARETTKEIEVNRSGKKTYTDKETDLLSKIPRPIFYVAIRAANLLNSLNLLPGGFIKSDPMYTSIFIANLGSVNMGAGFHHLYAWGNCPIFMMVGKIEPRAVVENDKVVVRKMMHFRFTFDERIGDGMLCRDGMEVIRQILENPEEGLGCVRKDKKDYWKVLTPREQREKLDPLPRLREVSQENSETVETGADRAELKTEELERSEIESIRALRGAKKNDNEQLQPVDLSDDSQDPHEDMSYNVNVG